MTQNKKSTPDVQLIPFDPKYRDAFRDLNLQWISKYFKVEKKDTEQTNNPEACVNEGGQVFFALHEGKAIGTCAMYVVSPGVFELAKMAVAEEARGKGIGDLLMNQTEAWAKSKGAKKILILSNTVLEPAIALYLKHGYQVSKLGSHPDYERCNIEMEKYL